MNAVHSGPGQASPAATRVVESQEDETRHTLKATIATAVAERDELRARWLALDVFIRRLRNALAAFDADTCKTEGPR